MKNILTPILLVLICFNINATPLSSIIEPPLTSIEKHTFEIGVTAVNLLLEQLDDKTPIPFSTVSLTAEMIIWKTSINIKRK